MANQSTTNISTLDDSLLAALRRLDTPTVCNSLELVVPERRGHGYTVKPLVCAYPQLPPMVGYAKTVSIKSEHPHNRSPEEFRQVLIDYYEYIAAGPLPSVVVVQDLDDNPGFGSFWGEVFTNVHKGFGASGAITNGSIRDMDDNAEGFQLLAGMIGPSHAYVRVEEFGIDVEVQGMAVSDGDLIHADRHGAVVIPHDCAGGVLEAAEVIAKREAFVIEASKQEEFSVAEFEKALAAAAGIKYPK
ncbi:MAG: RraA family protein [Rhodospirillales bacterium]|nr:RraA family protein [Rhodospirillales bacterium]